MLKRRGHPEQVFDDCVIATTDGSTCVHHVWCISSHLLQVLSSVSSFAPVTRVYR